MKTLKIVLVVLAVVILGFVGFVATRPNHFSIARSTKVAATPEVLYALVADLHEWPKWSPWEHKDPAMTKQYSGAASGVGQVYAWQGNKDVGKGRMTVMELVPGKSAKVNLEFLDPGPFTNTVRFDFVAAGDKTQVTWTMEGESDNFVHRVFALGMDALVGPDFEAGLANLKLAAETK